MGELLGPVPLSVTVVPTVAPSAGESTVTSLVTDPAVRIEPLDLVAPPIFEAAMSLVLAAAAIGIATTRENVAIDCHDAASQNVAKLHEQ